MSYPTVCAVTTNFNEASMLLDCPMSLVDRLSLQLFTYFKRFLLPLSLGLLILPSPQQLAGEDLACSSGVVLILPLLSLEYKRGAIPGLGKVPLFIFSGMLGYHSLFLPLERQQFPLSTIPFPWILDQSILHIGIPRDILCKNDLFC